MSRYYIFVRQMGDDDYKAWRGENPDDIIVIEAESKDDALKIFLTENGIYEEDAWLYYAAQKDTIDKEEAELKASGYTNWDDYYRDLWPERPIEL